MHYACRRSGFFWTPQIRLEIPTAAHRDKCTNSISHSSREIAVESVHQP